MKIWSNMKKLSKIVQMQSKMINYMLKPIFDEEKVFLFCKHL